MRRAGHRSGDLRFAASQKVLMTEMPPIAVAAPPMAQRGFTPFDLALYGGTILAWGFSWIAMRYQVGPVAPEVSVMWRFAIAAPIMLSIAVLRGESLRFPLADHARMVALGATLFATNFVLFYSAVAHLTSGLLSVVFSLAPIFNIALGGLLFGARVSRRGVGGSALGALGVAGLFYSEIAGAHLDRAAGIGLVLCVLGTLSFCAGNIASASLQKRGGAVFATTGCAMLYGTLIMAIYAAVRGRSFMIDTTPTYLGALIFLALISSVFAFACYLTLLGRVGAARASYMTVVLPVVALGVSTVLEGYVWTWPAALGLFAVLAGNVLVLRSGRAR
jgi:drug/metabolite transporter (DMT)-like permease